ncbi:MAG: GAF domain-containing protein [Candidatus Competibacteraceae bacterium]|nr:GAF domain-containing protein [Candidatus Competibacteraceae bacterium]
MTASNGSDEFKPMISLQQLNPVTSPNTKKCPAADQYSLAELLVPWVKCALENTGAETAIMLLACGDQLLIQAIASTENDTVRVKQAISINTLAALEEQCLLLPLSLINHVARTFERVLTGNALQDERIMSDPYIQLTQPLSILCEPIRTSTKLIGMMYLENHQVQDAFTEAHLHALNALCSQAASALE